MAEVIVNIKANTGQATNSVDDLNNSLNQTTESADDLSASLSKQEARIKTLDGAINLIGGSVELLAGGLALSGALTEEQAEQFQTAAIGAIAFADGTKRVLDGYKSLNEGLQAYGGVSKIASKATQALNAAIRANPAVAIATGIAILTAAIYAYVTSTDAAEEAEARRIDTEKEGVSQRLVAISREERLAKARGESIEEIARLRIETMQLRLEEIKLDRQRLQGPGGKNVVENQAEINKLGQDYLDLQTEIQATEIERDRAIAERNLKQKEQADAIAEANQKAAIEARNARLEYEGFRQTLAQLTDETIEFLGLFKNDNDLDKPLEQLEEVFEDFADIIFFTKEQLSEFEKAESVLEDNSLAARKKRLADYYDDLIKQASSNASEVLQLEKAKNKALDNLDDERKKNIEDAAKATLSTTIGLLATIRETTDDGSKEGFEKSKKFRIAETRLSSIQAGFDAYKSLVGIPYVGPILAVAAAAAALAAGQKAINDIKSSTFSDTAAPTASGASISAPTNINTGPQGQGQFLPFTAPQQQPPIRAYVVTGDVTTGQVAEAQLQTRRRFG